MLSSIASASDHVDHTRTQIPYALLCGGIAIGFGTIPGGLGVPIWVNLTLGVVALIILVRILGKPLDPEEG